MPSPFTAIIEDAFQQALVNALTGTTVFTTDIEAVREIDGMTYQVTNGGFAQSLFKERLEQMSGQGHFDDLLRAAVETITAKQLAAHLSGTLADQIIKGLEPTRGGYNREAKPGWADREIREIAVQALTQAVKDDDGLAETLRERVGISVDRDQIEINVGLKPRETD